MAATNAGSGLIPPERLARPPTRDERTGTAARVAPVDTRGLWAELRRTVQGETRFDDGSRALYAHDASNYRQVPLGVGPRFIIRDRDDKFGPEFDRAAEGVGAKVLKTPVRAPRANGMCERFLGSVRRECLDHVLVLGEWHLHEVLVEYCRYFNEARPHQGIDQRVPGGSSPAPKGSGAIVGSAYLNGLHHSYRRAAWTIAVALSGWAQ